MSDLIRKSVYIDARDVTVEVEYRLNFEGARSCGYIKVIKGIPKEEEEQYEIYMELLNCGLSIADLDGAVDKVRSEIEDGKLDVDF